jgi:hypothetical protein
MDGPSMRTMRDLMDGPSMRMMRDLMDGPSMRTMRDLMDGPSMRTMRDLMDGPSMRTMRDLIDTPSMRAMHGLFDSSSARVIRELVNDPAAQAIRAITSGTSNAAGQLFTNDVISLGGILSGASAQAVIGTLWANETVAAARAAGTINGNAGQSFLLDTLAAADPAFEETNIIGANALSAFLEKVSATTQRYLSAVHSAPELAGLMQLIMLFLTVAALYYASQSPSRRDLEEVDNSVKNETRVIENQFRSLVESIQQLARAKAIELPQRQLYQARRRVLVKAERKMLSVTVGQVNVGEQVAIRQIDGKWIEFDYFDYVSGQASHGWAVKKYFRRLR